MSRINEKYIYKITPKPNPNAVIKGEKYRFTVLTPGLIRMEYSEHGVFEDRATQIVINRNFDVPDFTVKKENGYIKIITDYIELTYYGGEFNKQSLTACYRLQKTSTEKWYFGEKGFNLKGTVRTLDMVDGECELDDGIMAGSYMAELNDSKSLVIDNDGWIDVREGSNTDVYLFAYMHDYFGALKAYYKLTGNTPLLPRYALGNWWSRYYKYTQKEYEELMLKFEEKGIPFSVAVIDMDWHYVDIDSKYGSGWTGFSWNKELFPDHKKFIEFLKKHGKRVTLNIHPAEGLASHEDVYEAAAEYMGISPKDKITIEFDVSNPKFIECYFEKILGPLEAEGVDFWWIDWQQGTRSRIEGLDPLWVLNHYHYINMKNTGKRAMIFSRYAGPGSHRYPIGFSGDTIMSWYSLEFQPYFTACASNIGYGWWSHDIGGHQGGERDDEMALRWVQYGVFSPIMRLHSTCNPFMSKEPWNYDKNTENIMIDFLRLRNKLIPYLYTMNYRNYAEGEPLIRPMYYYHPDKAQAYWHNHNQYYFGTEMIVIPITSKSDFVTRCGKAKAYLPEGLWFDLFNSRVYKGGRCMVMYRSAESIPVLVKAGGIIPISKNEDINNISNPNILGIIVYPGADNLFELYEDSGDDMEYENEVYSKTLFEYKWSQNPEFVINHPAGNNSMKIKDRGYVIEFRKINKVNRIKITEDGIPIDAELEYKNDNLIVKISNINGRVEIIFDEEVRICENNTIKEAEDLLLRAQCSIQSKTEIYDLLNSSKTGAEFAEEMLNINADDNLKKAVAEIMSAYSL